MRRYGPTQLSRLLSLNICRWQPETQEKTMCQPECKGRKRPLSTAGGQADVRSSSDFLFYSELQLIERGPD